MTQKAISNSRAGAGKAAGSHRAKSFRVFMKTLFARKIVLVAMIILVMIILSAILAPLISPYDPAVQSIKERKQGPSAAHLLGTDKYGRDVLSRIIYGGRVSLIVGVLAVIIACVIGTLMGMVAGYFGGWVDDLISRVA